MDDPYRVLGLTPSASQDDIRGAYRKLAKQHHPDLNPGNSKSEERFKAIASANDLLSDPNKRGQFDRGEIDAAGQERAPRSGYREHAERQAGRRYSRAGPDAETWSQDDLGDIFGSMFEGGRRHEVRGRDRRYVLNAGFLDAVNGATDRLSLPDGRTLDVKIPPGTIDGQMLRLRGQGDGGQSGGADGDALIEIRVDKHPFFRRSGNDILLVLPVTLSEAVLGAQIDIPTPSGLVRMRVPAGSDSGKRLRLRGRGVPRHDASPEGDLLATLRVEIGSPDAALQDFLRDWKPTHPIDPRQAMEMVR